MGYGGRADYGHVEELSAALPITIDVFARGRNALALDYASLEGVDQPRMHRFDAFKQRWRVGEVLWAFPPPALAEKWMKHVAKAKPRHMYFCCTLAVGPKVLKGWKGRCKDLGAVRVDLKGDEPTTSPFNVWLLENDESS